MEYRIRKSANGDYVVEKGITNDGGVEVGYKPGFTLPAFIVYESNRFDTLTEAKAFIEEVKK